MGETDYMHPDYKKQLAERDRQEAEREAKERQNMSSQPEPQSPRPVNQSAAEDERRAYVQRLAALRRLINTYQVDDTMLERFAVRAIRLMQGMRKRFGRDPDAADFLRAFRNELGLDEPRDPDDGTLIDQP